MAMHWHIEMRTPNGPLPLMICPQQAQVDDALRACYARACEGEGVAARHGLPPAPIPQYVARACTLRGPCGLPELTDEDGHR
jgi:hypothetical protein